MSRQKGPRLSCVTLPNALILIATLLIPATQAEIWFPHVSHEAGFTDDSAPMAPLNFGAQGGIPRYTSLASFYAGAFLFGLWFREHVFVSVFFYLLLKLFYALGFVLFAISTNTDSVVWNYGLINQEPLLTNRGAIGIDFFFLGGWAVILMGAFHGHFVSWSKIDIDHGGEDEGTGRAADRRLASWKAASIWNHFGVGCARCACCASAVGIKDPQDTPLGERTSAIPDMDPTTPAAWGKDDTTWTNIFLGNSPGAKVTFAAFGHDIFLFLMVGLATGPAGDIWDSGSLYWVSVGALVGVYIIILCTYQNYRYGDRVALDMDTKTASEQISEVITREELAGHDWSGFTRAYVAENAGRVYTRYFNKLEMLYFPFAHLLAFQVGVAVFYTIMDSEDAFRRINFAATVQEARRIAKENLLLELFSIFIIWAILSIAALVTYFLIVRCTRASLRRASKTS